MGNILVTSEELKTNLNGFTGTETYFKHFSGMYFTDGISYLAESAGCHWLIDLVASYQPGLWDKRFQIWTIVVNEDKTAVVFCKEDSNAPVLIKQELEYTDFPLEEFKCYCIDGILLLPSEY